MTKISTLEERRQRAGEAFWDQNPDAYGVDPAAAIETATRVHIDDAIVQASRPPGGTALIPGSVMWTRTRARLVRAFEAAGLEVTV